MSFINSKKKTNDKETTKQPVQKIVDSNNKTIATDKKENKNILESGIFKLKDLIAPSCFDRSNETYIRVGEKFTRSFVMQGYPSSVRVAWLDELFNYEGYLDTAIYVEPEDDRAALDELTNKITQFEAQLDIENRHGNIRNTTRLRNQIEQLMSQREHLEQNYENLFHIQIVGNMFSNSVEDLNKEYQRLSNSLRGRKITLMPMYLRQDEGFKSASPFGKTYIKDMWRNFNSTALTACFPFYNSEISHDDGVFCGVNLATRTPIFIDFYDRKILNSGNFTVFGQTGSGKTFFVSLLTLRSIFKGIKTTIIDPEGEYKSLTEAVGGSHIYISPDSETKLNPFDIEEEYLDDGSIVVKINDKVTDLLNLIGVMVGSLTQEQKSTISFIISDLYRDDFKINETKESLYDTQNKYDEKTQSLLPMGTKKRMPTISDFMAKLEKHIKEKNDKIILPVFNAMKMFRKGGIYDMFDCQTSSSLVNFKDSPIVTFDISKIESDSLRPVGIFIAMNWTWEKFGKKDPEQKKRIVCDEAWMLLNKSMPGHEYTSEFLETAARRIRKRNGGLLVASQGFSEFAENPHGQAVLKNTSVQIFLRQSETDIDGVQNTFKLSNGERNFLLSAQKGNYLIRMQNESSVGFALAFDYEVDKIKNKHPEKRRDK